VRQIFPADPAGPELGPAAAAGPGTITALARLYAYPEHSGSPDRPWVRANMIASADGAATLAGRTRRLSGAADRLLFSVLRSLADVILVGAGTVQAERYRPVPASEAWPALRAGRPPAPPIAVLTRALDLDPDGPLLARAPDAARTIVLTTEAAPADRRAAVARHADVIVAGQDAVAPGVAVDALAGRGYPRILVEGGPTLLGQIAAAGLLDELCLTIGPLLAGGSGGRIVADLAYPADLSLAHVLEDEGFLLCRYLRLAG
jgi:riboflavin biosynthesis pyrimidine reductase